MIVEKCVMQILNVVFMMIVFLVIAQVRTQNIMENKDLLKGPLTQPLTTGLIVIIHYQSLNSLPHTELFKYDNYTLSYSVIIVKNNLLWIIFMAKLEDKDFKNCKESAALYLGESKIVKCCSYSFKDFEDESCECFGGLVFAEGFGRKRCLYGESAQREKHSA